MTDETRKLFNAPWKAVEMVDTNFPYLHECEIVSNNGNGHMIATEVLRADANRLARLPELYDALLHAVCTSCNVCIYDHCGSPVDCEQLLSQECAFEDNKCCFEYKARELLKKVRDGE